MTRVVIKSILLACGAVALGAATYPSTAGDGHELFEYVGVFQGPPMAGHVESQYLSILLHDGILYAAARGGDARACWASDQRADGIYIAEKYPLPKFGRLVTGVLRAGPFVIVSGPRPGMVVMIGPAPDRRLATPPPADESRIASIVSTPTGLKERSCSRDRQCRGTWTFWPRIADAPNVWDMFEFDSGGEPRYCVPVGLLQPGIIP